MSKKLTREQIESWKWELSCRFEENELAQAELIALCDLALAGLEAQSWSEWKGEGPAPASWYAVNPQTGERTKVYRSYGDYVDD